MSELLSIPASEDLWIFGYGSLMWKPGFEFAEASRARLTGYRRCFCIYSTHHRGTHERPGLVLGLDRSGVCDGVAYRVAAAEVQPTLAYLRAREQVNGVYRECHVPIALGTRPRRDVEAVAFIVERAHPSYAGRLALPVQARLIRGARGISGANLDYLINTVAHLAELGISEPELERLLTIIGPHFARSGAGTLARPGAAALLAHWRRRPVAAPRLRIGDRRRFLYRRQMAIWAARKP